MMVSIEANLKQNSERTGIGDFGINSGSLGYTKIELLLLDIIIAKNFQHADIMLYMQQIIPYQNKRVCVWWMLLPFFYTILFSLISTFFLLISCFYIYIDYLE